MKIVVITGASTDAARLRRKGKAYCKYPSYRGARASHAPIWVIVLPFALARLASESPGNRAALVGSQCACQRRVVLGFV